MTEENEEIETTTDFYQAAWTDDLEIEKLRKELSQALRDVCEAKTRYEATILQNQ